MILVLTTRERHERTGQMQLLVSHGIDLETDQTIVLPQVAPSAIGAILDHDLEEYALLDPPARPVRQA